MLLMNWVHQDILQWGISNFWRPTGPNYWHSGIRPNTIYFKSAICYFISIALVASMGDSNVKIFENFKFPSHSSPCPCRFSVNLAVLQIFGIFHFAYFFTEITSFCTIQLRILRKLFILQLKQLRLALHMMAPLIWWNISAVWNISFYHMESQ